MPHPPFVALARRLDAVQVRHALKTALACLLALGLTRLLGLEQGYWAVISTIIVMQSHIGGSLKAGWSRPLGTASGAVLAILTVSLLGSGPLALGVAIFLSVLVCFYLLVLHESFRIAGVTAAIIIFVHREGESVLRLAVDRCAEISLGILAALAVSFLLWPSRARQVLGHGLAETFAALAGLLDRLAVCRLESEYAQTDLFGRKERIVRLLTRNRELLAAALAEPGAATACDRLAFLLRRQERLFENLLTLDHLARDARPGDRLHKLAADEILALVLAEAQVLRLLAERLNSAAALDDPAALAPALSALSAASEGMDERLLDLRRQQATVAYDLDEVIRFFSFAQALKEAARELRDAAPGVPAAACWTVGPGKAAVCEAPDLQP